MEFAFNKSLKSMMPLNVIILKLLGDILYVVYLSIFQFYCMFKACKEVCPPKSVVSFQLLLTEMENTLIPNSVVQCLSAIVFYVLML